MGKPDPIPFHLGDLGPAEIAPASACLNSGNIGGEGGVLLVQDEALFRRAEVAREKGTDRDPAMQTSLRAHLAGGGVAAPSHFVPLHTTAFARRLLGSPRNLPVTNDAAATLLRLPLYPRLTEGSQQRAIEAVRDWAGRV